MSICYNRRSFILCDTVHFGDPNQKRDLRRIPKIMAISPLKDVMCLYWNMSGYGCFIFAMPVPFLPVAV